MEIAQQENSLEEITEIDPLQIAEILGNVGGFWGESREEGNQRCRRRHGDASSCLPEEGWG